MKWFQVDSNTITDPRIEAVIERFGNAGLGALFRLWCFTARHGGRPGWTIDSRGRPISRSFLEQATGLNSNEFDCLITFVIEIGHVVVRRTRTGPFYVFPAMSRRVDSYTARVVRTMFEQSPNNVRDNTRQDNTRQKINTPSRSAPVSSPRDSFRVVVKLAREIVDRTPPADRSYANLKEQIKKACARVRVPYDAAVVGKAIDAALAVDRKQAAAK